MHNFNLRAPPRILFGKSQIAALAEHLPTGSRAMATYGGGIKLNGVLGQVRRALASDSSRSSEALSRNPTTPR